MQDRTSARSTKPSCNARPDHTSGQPDQMHENARTRRDTRLTRAVCVILAHTTPVTAALQCETRTIQIVFVNVSDPVDAGFIESLTGPPGGNLTGLLQHEAGIFGKWLAMPKEIAPRVARVAMNTSCAPQKPPRRCWRSRFCAAWSRTQPTFPRLRLGCALESITEI
jgi:hypothetical protein